MAWGAWAMLPVVWAKLESNTVRRCVHPRHPKARAFEGASDTYCSCWSVKWPGSWSQSPKGPYLRFQLCLEPSLHDRTLQKGKKLRRRHHHHHHHHDPTFTCSSVWAKLSDLPSFGSVFYTDPGCAGLPTLVVTANRGPDAFRLGMLFPQDPMGWNSLKPSRSNGPMVQWSNATRQTLRHHSRSAGGKHGGVALSGVEHTLPTSEESDYIPFIWGLNRMVNDGSIPDYMMVKESSWNAG